MTIAPFIELWLSHKPITESGSLSTHRGTLELDPAVEDTLRAIELVTDDQIFCLQDLQYSSGRVEVGIKDCPFSWHYALNKPDSIIHPEHQHVINALPNRKDIATRAGLLPWTFNAITLTTDNYLLCAKRKPGSVTIANWSIIPSGYSNKNDQDEETMVSLRKTIRREFLEELLIGNTNAVASLSPRTQHDLCTRFISDVSAHGISYVDHTNRGFGAAYRIVTTLDKKGVMNLFDSREDDEHSLVDFVAFEPDAVEQLIKSKKLSMHCTGALLLVGRNYFGQRWYESMISKHVQQEQGRVLVLPTNTFASRRQITEVLKHTQQERYGK